MSGQGKDIILDDRTLIELIGGIALDLLENDYAERDLGCGEAGGKKCAYPVEVFKRRISPFVKMFSGVTLTSLVLFGTAAVLVKKYNHMARA